MQCDVASFSSIRMFADQINQRRLKLKILVNNAGVSMGKTFALSEDGIELTFATNHLGHFLLTNLLLDDLKRNAPSKIVVITSKIHIPGVGSGPPPDFKWTLDSINDPVTLTVAYKNSKLANVWFTYELARRLEGSGVTVNAVCPGFVTTTGLFRHSTWMMQMFLRWILYYAPFARTEDHAGECIIHASLDPSLEGVTGKMFSDMKLLNSSPVWSFLVLCNH